MILNERLPYSGNKVLDERYKQIHRENWQTGTTFGRAVSQSFLSWKPFVWNTVCVVMSSSLGFLRTYLNGKIVLEDNYSGVCAYMLVISDADWSTSVSRTFPRNCWRQLSYAIRVPIIGPFRAWMP